MHYPRTASFPPWNRVPSLDRDGNSVRARAPCSAVSIALAAIWNPGASRGHWRRECSARGWGCARWHAASRHGVCGARRARGRPWVFGRRGVDAAGAAVGAALPRARVLRRPGDLVGVCTPGDANIAFRLSTGTWIRREVEPGGGHVQCRLFSIPCFRLFHGIYSQGFDGFLA